MATAASPRSEISLADLDISLTRQGWDFGAQRNKRSNGQPLTIGQRRFQSGLGTVADSLLQIDLKQAASRFTAWVGPDALGGPEACVRFTVVVDGKIAAHTPAMKGGSAPLRVSVDLTGARVMVLAVDVAGNRTWGNYADWCDAVITLASGSTALPVAEPYQPDMTIPLIERGNQREPTIHAPYVLGTTPGKPFIFRIPVTGAETVSLDVEGLPPGISLDKSGVLRGSITAAGDYEVVVTARNPHGSSRRKLKVQAGERCLALTPPMGWNSWNAFGEDVHQDLVKQQADELIKSGLANKGYNLIVVDAGWEGDRDSSGRLMPDKDKFPDIRTLIEYVHSLGLKFGIYSSPGLRTCGSNGGFTGSYGYEVQDIWTFAEWGADYLKYDWCTYESMLPPHASIEAFIEPYAVVGQAIATVKRDIIFHLCQYGMKDVWKWGPKLQVNGNVWRISDDLIDFWGAVCANGFYSDRTLAPYAGPGRWNDPDMLVLGTVDFTSSTLGFPGRPQPTRLTPTEQQTHMTMWVLLAAPLIIGGDLSKLDTFTLNLLGNPEVLAIDQDPLGRQAQCVKDDQWTQIWARPLADGTIAVGMFNLSPITQSASVQWNDLVPIMQTHTIVEGKQSVRDLWQCRDLGPHIGFTVDLPSHGSIFLKVGTPEELIL
jgi:alpha-galactosidase